MPNRTQQQIIEAIAAARLRAMDAVRNGRPWPEIKAANEAVLTSERELEMRATELGDLDGRSSSTPPLSESPNYQAMVKAAEPLLAAGFKVTRLMPDDKKSFGNALLELTSTDLVVRLSSDRSIRELIIASTQNPAVEIDLGPILVELGVTEAPGASWATFDSAVVALLAHRNELPAAIPRAREANRRSIEALIGQAKGKREGNT